LALGILRFQLEETAAIRRFFYQGARAQRAGVIDRRHPVIFGIPVTYMMKTKRLYRVVVGVSVCFGLLAFLTLLSMTSAQSAGWDTYTSDDAAYSFEYPTGAAVSTSDDASLRYRMVYVEFNVTTTTEYQGISVMVLENPKNLTAQQFVSSQYQAAGIRATTQAQRGTALKLADRQAIKLQRDAVIGNGDKYTVLIPGNGAMYRVNLYGGGVGGPVEPPAETRAIFDHVVKSFRVLQQALKPKTNVLSRAPAVDPPVATVFTYPLRSGGGVNYGVPLGIVVDNTHLEWLGYGIRNLDQWGVKCYNVDWARMIHTGEDWYRLDGANTVGMPVYAIADGVVAKQNPGISYPGNVVLIRHRLPDGRDIYSMYGHVANVSVVEGQIVQRGQQIATVIYQSYTGRTPAQHPAWDSHVHFEMRWFLDGSNIYAPGTNAYGYNYPGCTWSPSGYPGRGYTYIIHPDNYPYPGAGYVGPTAFINAHLGQPSGTCMPSELIANGGFENGVPGTPWTATNSKNQSDPLIYTRLPHTGSWGGWLGNVLNYTDTLAQAVNIPQGARVVTMTFWLNVSSTEPAGGANDHMVAVLRSAPGQTIGTALNVTTAATRDTWVKQAVTFDVSAYAGQQVTLNFTGYNDGANKSSFYIDDVSLLTQCP
jgi:murein DD-endopeptidase MepM/ murein hydrolase activator NlpD